MRKFCGPFKTFLRTSIKHVISTWTGACTDGFVSRVGQGRKQKGRDQESETAFPGCHFARLKLADHGCENVIPSCSSGTTADRFASSQVGAVLIDTQVSDIPAMS